MGCGASSPAGAVHQAPDEPPTKGQVAQVKQDVGPTKPAAPAPAAPVKSPRLQESGPQNDAARPLVQQTSAGRQADGSITANKYWRTGSVRGMPVTMEEEAIQALKEKLQKEWAPEYEPEEIRPPQDSPEVHSERATHVTLSQILTNEEFLTRKTKIICTAGPACWSEEGLGKILDAGCNVLRLNFSHGDHDGHYAVLERFRKVCTAKKMHAAILLDTKGPEVRTAMLRDHKSIELEAGQPIIIEAVGDRYISFEGYKTDSETRIGLSYAKLCQSVKPGNKILLADGSISITVDEILSDTTLKGTVLNKKSLGERKNGNLPGVKVDIPVLTQKDIDDLQQFAALHGLDFVAASFVQSAADVQFIRKTLDDAGGTKIKIISKIENLEGLTNYDEILRESDGIMVARGDLGMEIPSEKVPVAQKMMITKANIAGKFVICATQMLESMIENPRPTRAEMTDVANAVYDGTDAVMLSGESANGKFSEVAVATMAAIVANAEIGVDYYSQTNFIRYWNTHGYDRALAPAEAIMACAGLMAVGFTEDTTPEVLKKIYKSKALSVIVTLTATGSAANLVSKYRPPSIQIVASKDPQVLRQCGACFGQLPLKVDSLEMDTEHVASIAVEELKRLQLMPQNADCKVIVVRGKSSGNADIDPVITVVKSGSTLRRKGWSTGNSLYSPSGVPIQRPGTRSLRSTLTSLPLITAKVREHRSTKVVCTMGPACWSEETMGQLLDAGMDIIRLNFSHGDHKGHYEVLERFRKVTARKAEEVRAKHKYAPAWACLLDTKGPEIRTAMLRDHKSIELEAGQPIIIEAVGERYTTFEGYKTATETRIGLSYGKLCQSVKEGNKILLADGSISITVDEILSETTLRGTVLNSKTLGERKNGNLPGVKVDIPVLTDKDIDDLQNFCAKHKMDYVAASFVQSADDVRFIRQVLDGAEGGSRVKIISKIENAEGLVNYDEILAESDGIMVARGDLGMEIPAEKVPLAQKMMITKANIMGKFIITATQMLESMISNPRPTRAEMTDVANAVLDGTDAVMLSGETANGSFPVGAVQTMAAICQNAEHMVEHHKRYDFLRNHTPKPMAGAEAVCSGAVQTAIDTEARAVVCITTSGRAASMVSKYRPPVPIIVVTPDESIVRHCQSSFGQIGVLVGAKDIEGDYRPLVLDVLKYMKQQGVVTVESGDEIVIVQRRVAPAGTKQLSDDQRLIMKTMVVGTSKKSNSVEHTSYPGSKVLFHRSTKVGMDTILDPAKWKFIVRKTKIVCTAGPACWSEENLTKILKAGCNVLRFNFSHGDHKGHYEVLERFRKVCKNINVNAACLLDTKGPEIRTAMLRDHKSIELEAGQPIIIEAVGERYTTFEGYKTATETRIGLSYGKLCQSVRPGNKILLADGSISITVDEILSDTTLKGTVLNKKSLGERKNGNLPGVKVDIPVLTEKDIDDLKNFCAKHKMDFVAASFVQSASDVQFIRRILDEAGGKDVKIISKIENAEGLKNYDEILQFTDGIMVARGDLGMEIPVEKVPLAQKMMITKANIAGKFVITATQMLESMITNPMPTRAEMTDVANAVFDGTDAVMLSGESANGAYPDIAVGTMARIARSAEIGVNYYQTYDYIRRFTPKPVGAIEGLCSAIAKNAVDIRPGMIIIFSETGRTARLLSKYRPCAPVLVVTANPQLARYCQALFSLHSMLLPSPIQDVKQARDAVEKALKYGIDNGLCVGGKEVLVLSSTMVIRGPNDASMDLSETLPAREMFVTVAPGVLDQAALGAMAPVTAADDPKWVAKTISLRSTVIDYNMLIDTHAPVRKTKIAVTLGPVSSSDLVLERLVDAGMNVARFNFSHGTLAGHVDVLTRLRKICASKGRRVATLMDLAGPCIRTCYLIDKETKARVQKIELKAGDTVKLKGTSNLSPEVFVGYRTDKEVVLPVSLPDLADVVKPGSIIRLQDGIIDIEVTGVSATGGSVYGTVVNGSFLYERKALHIVGVTLRQKVLTTDDMQAVNDFAIAHKVDYVAMSQVRNGSDLIDLRTFLDDSDGGGEKIKIIAKIETEDSLKDLDNIIEAADAVMLARGNLGMAVSPEKVALVQSLVVTKANVAGKPCIISRQMLDSMTTNPRPTRAEMTDVANAVLESAHCIMLCAETATGAFPVDCLVTASNISRNAEHAMNYVSIGAFIRDFSPKPYNTVEAAAVALAHACTDGHLGLCVIVSDSGEAANLVAKYRPPVPQVVITSQEVVQASCELTFGQFAMQVSSTHLSCDVGPDLDALIARAVSWARGKGLMERNGKVAVMHGTSTADTSTTALIKIVEM